MKILFIIAFLLSGTAYAQCDTANTPPIRVIFDMKMNTPYFDYYNSDGLILWKRVKFDSTLIPAGGYARRLTTNKTIEGYAVFKVVDLTNCTLGLIRWMDLNFKDIDGTVKYYEFKR
jgi:hypothetical protein